jgi:hypothetical protein
MALVVASLFAANPRTQGETATDTPSSALAISSTAFGKYRAAAANSTIAAPDIQAPMLPVVSHLRSSATMERQITVRRAACSASPANDSFS